ncbi:neutral zinc metallopeptidase [uncultured Amaricoccus sp.]|uniref:KPN_02809 family neutral zinc metallopeptidase n=1 Tax=uncultured Amaricoccus sp. TaxID=339341 RepID=UPI00262D8FB8|nr:neutral zinc metallopeptidase [uncultured Amaricoccus sp.]
MDWRGRRQSTNIEDRRGGGMGGGPLKVGGMGVVVVLILGVLFGVDLSPLVGGGGGRGGPVVVGEAPTDAQSQENKEFVGVVLAETEDVWGAVFQGSGLDYTQPRLVLFSGVDRSACGTAQSAMGPFYCPNDQTVYLDTDFFNVMTQRLGSRGEFARAYVIAHEVGHHVQDELGVLGQVNAQRARASEAQSNALSVRVELQADCYAGLWARAAKDRLALTDDDIRSALDTAARIGDDALQRTSQGIVVPDSFTHGSSEQRQTWFYKGFQTGDPSACDTFQARAL